jgi:L-ascorbate metabolism protein UlaG (beta-lactamase superfamily)
MARGRPAIVRKPGQEAHGGVAFRSLATHHDTSQGAARGENVVRVMEADGLRICHLGDLGHSLSAEDAAALGAIDVLMVPVGGTYTIDAAGATAVVNQLRPKIAIPMHFKTPKAGLPLSPVDGFLAGKPRVRRVAGSEIEVTPQSLPEPTEIVVLEPAL